MEIVGFKANNLDLLSLEVGTNCPQGGNRSHGGRTYFKLKNQTGNAALGFDVQYSKLLEKEHANPYSWESIEIVLGGDFECESFIKCLEYAAERLRTQFEFNKSQQKLNEYTQKTLKTTVEINGFGDIIKSRNSTNASTTNTNN